MSDTKEVLRDHTKPREAECEGYLERILTRPSEGGTTLLIA